MLKDDDEYEYAVRQRLGYKPDAPAPDLSNVRSNINNRQRTAVRRRMQENKSRKPGNIGERTLKTFSSSSMVELPTLLRSTIWIPAQKDIVNNLTWPTHLPWLSFIDVLLSFEQHDWGSNPARPTNVLPPQPCVNLIVIYYFTRRGRFNPCLRLGYFLLWSSDCMMETCMLLAGVSVLEHWWTQ